MSRVAPPEFAEKLYNEFLLLNALGLIDSDGEIRCGECDRIVERPPTVRFAVACECGWRMEDV